MATILSFIFIHLSISSVTANGITMCTDVRSEDFHSNLEIHQLTERIQNFETSKEEKIYLKGYCVFKKSELILSYLSDDLPADAPYGPLPKIAYLNQKNETINQYQLMKNDWSNCYPVSINHDYLYIDCRSSESTQLWSDQILLNLNNEDVVRLGHK